MTNEELATHLKKVGTSNRITISGKDLDRLLETAFSYNFLMDFIKKISEKNYTEEVWKLLHRQYKEVLSDVYDRTHRGFMPPLINSQLLWVFRVVEEAHNLIQVHPVNRK